MNTGLVVTLMNSGGTRKYIAAVVVSLVVIVSLPFMSVLALGEEALSFLAATPNAEAAATQGFYMGPEVPGNTYAWGNCTYWSFAMRLWAGSPIPATWGNANTWDDRARADGYEVNHTPRVGAVFQSDRGEFGHVAYVFDVDAVTGAWTISEMNVKGLNIVSTRTFSKDSAAYYNFIHSKIGAPLWTPAPLLITGQ